jgi:hypothetical protein
MLGSSATASVRDYIAPAAWRCPCCDRMASIFRPRTLFSRLAVAIVTVGGCGGGATTDVSFDAGSACQPVPTYAALQARIFGPRCAGRCHGGALMPPTPAAAGPIDLSATSTRAELVDRASIHGMGLVLVVAGDPGASFLLRKLTNDLPADGSLGNPMPQGEAIRWSMSPQAEIDAITCWIAGGAP